MARHQLKVNLLMQVNNKAEFNALAYILRKWLAGRNFQ